MKKIVALIDFSASSINALAFAAELSKRSQANLLVVNAFSDDENDAKSKVFSVEAELKKSFLEGVNYEVLSMKGSLISVVDEINSYEKPDLIVMGTKGVGGLKKILIGSNAIDVIAEIKTPTLVVPESARFDDFIRKGKNRIVLATDLELLDNEHCVDILKEIALFIDEPKVRVLSVRPPGTKLPELKKIERSFLLSVFAPEIESKSVTVFGDHVLEGINYYLNKKDDCGLVAMIANDSGAFFEKHYTREMASHAELPLLILHDVKI